MGERVAILGGGVAGLSAAHELVERGFRVDVYEAKATAGGKARSMPVPGTGTEGRPDLPGEHGFRFFPGFYKHLPDTMRRIPYGGQAEGVAGNLVRASKAQIARQGSSDPVVLAGWPDSLRDGLGGLWSLATADWGVSPYEMGFFLSRIAMFATSSEERRLEQWEGVSWWDFVQAERMSDAYRTLLAKGMTRSLVAVRAEVGSTRTVGTILLQMLVDMWRTDGTFDRLLNGPTNEVWIDPWVQYLQGLGMAYHREHAVVGIDVDDGRVQSVRVDAGGGEQTVTADWYICALPVEKLAALVTDELRSAEPRLSRLGHIDLEWMNGIQFYLRQDLPIVRGHAVYPDTPWALTSVSQQQFWDRSLAEYGDGTVRGCLSVDISNWTVPGVLYGKRADALDDPEQVKNEVWAQLKQTLDEDAHPELKDADLAAWFLDPAITMRGGGRVDNSEPLVVNTVGSWMDRPTAVTRIRNFFLASDYVRTFTDLATMEGANEAARRAVNGILHASGSQAKPCRLWPLSEPGWLEPWKRLDGKRFRRGQPHLWDWGG